MSRYKAILHGDGNSDNIELRVLGNGHVRWRCGDDEGVLKDKELARLKEILEGSKKSIEKEGQ